jgi:hypothetical protein
MRLLGLRGACPPMMYPGYLGIWSRWFGMKNLLEQPMQAVMQAVKQEYSGFGTILELLARVSTPRGFGISLRRRYHAPHNTRKCNISKSGVLAVTQPIGQRWSLMDNVPSRHRLDSLSNADTEINGIRMPGLVSVFQRRKAGAHSIHNGDCAKGRSPRPLRRPSLNPIRTPR